MNEVTLILQDADSKTPGSTEVRISWTTKGIEIHPLGTDVATGGAPIFLERYKGHVRVLVWADIDQEDPTHDISLAGAYKSQAGQGPEHLELVKRSIPCLYTSKWDNGEEINLPCLYDPIKQVVFDIEATEQTIPDEILCLEEYITMGDVQLKAEDGITFNY